MWEIKKRNLGEFPSNLCQGLFSAHVAGKQSVLTLNDLPENIGKNMTMITFFLLQNYAKKAVRNFVSYGWFMIAWSHTIKLLSFLYLYIYHNNKQLYILIIT